MSGKRSSVLRSNGRPASAGRLAARRRQSRRLALFVVVALSIFSLGAVIYVLSREPVRISSIEVVGTNEPLAGIAIAAMKGSYLGIISRDSIFFFPAERIRADILAAYPEIAALSITRTSLTSISLTANNRVPVASWCGSTYPPQDASSTPNCYFFDAKGFVYAPAASLPAQAGSRPAINQFDVYEDLETGQIIGATLPGADALPLAFNFARQLYSFGSPVTTIAIHGGEADDYLASGTRITYLLGDEQNVYTALVSGKQNFNLADGSIEYIDLRFTGKIYLKRK